VDDTIAELRNMSGPLLDPECVQAFLEMVEEDPELAEPRLCRSA
jgi:HD-GYP domain-containing protein (c-di-GMP phosphodiesterase class II)